MANSTAIEAWSYLGTKIRRDASEFVSLTDMWKAGGADEKKRPAQWSRTDGARAFIEYVEDLNCADTHNSAIRSEAGVAGGTWAHWQIAMAYAKYLSPAFHAWCNETIRRVMAGEPVRTSMGAVDAAIANGSRMDDTPESRDEVRRLAKAAANQSKRSLQSVYGMIRSSEHVSSPFCISSVIWELRTRRKLEEIACGRVLLPPQRRQLAAVTPINRRQLELPTIGSKS